MEQHMNPLAKVTKYQTPIELRFRNQNKREGETQWELRELERGERGRPTTTPPSLDHPHNLETTYTTKHSGIHHTHGYITSTPPSITHHRQSTTTLIHPYKHHDPNPPIYKTISMTKDPKPKTHNLHHKSISMQAHIPGKHKQEESNNG